MEDEAHYDADGNVDTESFGKQVISGSSKVRYDELMGAHHATPEELGEGSEHIRIRFNRAPAALPRGYQTDFSKVRESRRIDQSDLQFGNVYEADVWADRSRNDQTNKFDTARLLGRKGHLTQDKPVSRVAVADSSYMGKPATAKSAAPVTNMSLLMSKNGGFSSS